MKKCENCGSETDGMYGSGRFCGKKCACAYSTKERRSEISESVSRKLKGREPAHAAGFKKGNDPRRRKFGPKDWSKAVEVNKARLEALYKTMDWLDLPAAEQRRRILVEQNNCCLRCGLKDWLHRPLILELHHVDGDHQNRERSNLEILCPNCHSQTDNWKNKSRSEVGKRQTTEAQTF